MAELQNTPTPHIGAKQGAIDYEQLMAFTYEVLRHYPALDGDRLGVMGISYGGSKILESEIYNLK